MNMSPMVTITMPNVCKKTKKSIDFTQFLVDAASIELFQFCVGEFLHKDHLHLPDNKARDCFNWDTNFFLFLQGMKVADVHKLF